ncbi:hypothetical protein FK515_28465 [Klebsiella pneumoniae]|nr:hypothetical protein [Klebsiella pneumoniae]
MKTQNGENTVCVAPDSEMPVYLPKGSTFVGLLLDLSTRPIVVCELRPHRYPSTEADQQPPNCFEAMLDTGADVTVISLTDWPKELPLAPVATPLKGVGGSQRALRSQYPARLSIKGEKGETTIRPYVLNNLSVSLLGRDVLQSLKVQLSIEKPF